MTTDAELIAKLRELSQYVEEMPPVHYEGAASEAMRNAADRLEALTKPPIEERFTAPKAGVFTLHTTFIDANGKQTSYNSGPFTAPLDAEAISRPDDGLVAAAAEARKRYPKGEIPGMNTSIAALRFAFLDGVQFAFQQPNIPRKETK